MITGLLTIRLKKIIIIFGAGFRYKPFRHKENKMKKLIALFIAVLMLTLSSSFVFPSGAEGGNDLNLSLTNAAGLQNEEITVELNITENSGFYCLWFLLYYDSDTFILRDTKYNKDLAEYGEFWKTKDNQTVDQFSGPISDRAFEYLKDYNISANDKNFKIIFFDSNSIEEDVTYTGNVATFTFQIMGIADDGDYTIGIIPSFEDIINVSDDQLNVTWSNATVRVGSEKEPVETQKIISQEDTVDASEITEDPYEYPGNITDTDPVSDSETDGKESGADSNVGSDVETDGTDTEKEPDVEVETKPSSDNEVEVFGKSFPIIYIIIGSLAVLVIAAAILTAVFIKSKKKKQ